MCACVPAIGEDLDPYSYLASVSYALSPCHFKTWRHGVNGDSPSFMRE